MSKDWQELIESLKSHDVEFLVAGSAVLALYARARYTEDLDIFVRRSQENVDNLERALSDFGMVVRKGALADLADKERQMVVLGAEPYAVDLLNFLDGIDFDDAWQNKVAAPIHGVEAYHLSVEDYVKTKRASGRNKDLLDLELLREVRPEAVQDKADVADPS